MVSCNTEFEVVKPIYLSVRREAFLHANIGNPTNPYDYDSIASVVGVAVNDVQPPYANIVNDIINVGVDVYPCSPTKPVVGTAQLVKSDCTLAGIFTALVYRFLRPQIFAEGEEFVGLKQTVAYSAVGAMTPTADEFDIQIRLIGGAVNGKPNYIGYTGLVFQPDNPAEPNGTGAYFFVIWPEVRIRFVG